MKRTLTSISLLIAAAVALLTACSNDVTRRDVAASLTELVIAPQHEAAAQAAEDLNERTRRLASDPTPGRLEAAQDSWLEARSRWSRIQAYTFGPVMELRLPSLVSWWPIDHAKIEAAIERTSISAEDVRETFAADQRGFFALEYLLFADDALYRLGSDAYGQYLTALSQVIADAVRRAADEWSGEYGNTFSGRGDRVVAESLAIADIVRVPVFLTETIGDMQLGIALGIVKAEADLSVIPEGNAGAAVDDLLQNVRGIQDTYVGGADGLGISDLITQLSEAADDRMRNALTDAVETLEALHDRGESLVVLLQTEPDAAAEARDALKAVQVMLNTEIVSLLGVTIGFSDNDGDS